jgi:hypothetical protein
LLRVVAVVVPVLVVAVELAVFELLRLSLYLLAQH